jgi:hypothetical protein
MTTGKNINKSLAQIVRYRGIFDIEEVYKAAYDWLRSRGMEVQETKFKTYNRAHGREHQIVWKAWNNETDFIRNWIFITWRFIDIVELEVVKDGKKKKLSKCQADIRIQHAIDFDYTERFTKTTLQIHALDFIQGWLFRKKIDTLWEDKLRFKCYELQNVLKETLEAQTKGNEHYDVW